jgi:hypothetical protein
MILANELMKEKKYTTNRFYTLSGKPNYKDAGRFITKVIANSPPNTEVRITYNDKQRTNEVTIIEPSNEKDKGNSNKRKKRPS